MKKAILTIILFYILVLFGGGMLGIPIIKAFIGGGIHEEFLYPIYWGIMLLAGLIVLCTEVLRKEIKEIKAQLLNDKISSDITEK